MLEFWKNKKNGRQEMKVGIMQPYFFPYLGYWQLINAVDKYVVYDDVNYIKGGWISRNNILLNGAKHMITMPLCSPSPNKKINEIEIKKDRVAVKKVIKTIKAAYLKAPYYTIVMPIIERLIEDANTIAILNYNSIVEIGKYLDFKTEILLSSKIEKNNELKGVDKVIQINKILGADTYYNAIGGQELYSKKEFCKAGQNLYFLKMKDIEYKQYNHEFVSSLSIIDVLMFNSVEKIQEMLRDYTLV